MVTVFHDGDVLTADMLNGLRPPSLLVFGDSWTTMSDGALPKRLAELLHASWSKSYGVSGAKIADIAGQVDAAGKDASFDNASVTHIMVIGGTNDVFDPPSTSDADMKTAVAALCANLAKYYPDARVHWYPDNSRTDNGRRTGLYRTMIDEFHKDSGIAVHPELLWTLCKDDFSLYMANGGGRQALQHLTADGYGYLAGVIASSMLGGSLEATATAHAQFMYQLTQAAQRLVNMSEYKDTMFTVKYREGSYDIMVNLPELNVTTGQTADTLSMALYTRDNAKDGAVSYGQFSALLFPPDDGTHVIQTRTLAMGDQTVQATGEVTRWQDKLGLAFTFTKPAGATWATTLPASDWLFANIPYTI